MTRHNLNFAFLFSQWYTTANFFLSITIQNLLFIVFSVIFLDSFSKFQYILIWIKNEHLIRTNLLRIIFRNFRLKCFGFLTFVKVTVKGKMFRDEHPQFVFFKEFSLLLVWQDVLLLNDILNYINRYFPSVYD